MRHMEEEIQHELQKPIKKTTRELSEPARQTTEQLILKEQQDQILEESHYQHSDGEEYSGVVDFAGVGAGQVKGPSGGNGYSIRKRDRFRVYTKMVPSFTNNHRKKLYYNDPNFGFGFINWDIEEELYKFQ